MENNFNAIDFLTKGGYPSSPGVVAGVLKPWPSNILPATACTAPVANAGGPYTVASLGTVTLGSARRSLGLEMSSRSSRAWAA